jgi:hypothetical protein
VTAQAHPVDHAEPNYFDGPMTFYAVVDKTGHASGFGSEAFARELMERWEKTLTKFAPFRIIKLVEDREGA